MMDMIDTKLPKIIGYLRVSTEGQHLEKNRADILVLANRENLGRVSFVEEKVSGKTSWRDRKIVSELSRLGRSMLECMEILSIASARKIHVYAIKGNWRLDETIQSKIVAMAFSMAAEIERDLISARTTEALKARKASGLPLGRPKGPGKSKLDQYRPEIEALLANGSTQRFIAKRYGTTPANLSNWIKKTPPQQTANLTAVRGGLRTNMQKHPTLVITNIRFDDQPKEGAQIGFHWLSGFSIPVRYQLDNWITPDAPDGDPDPAKPWEIELPPWLYNAILRQRDILAVHPDYFKLTGGIERWLYRLARKSVPDTADNPVSAFRMDTLFERSGLSGRLRDFRTKLEDIAARQPLPEYDVVVTTTDKRHQLVTLIKNRTKPPQIAPWRAAPVRGRLICLCA